uniref:Uncharacterized protein n=1 Tax=Spongospora subterranea TaxID=70186 RepID=A0A0H5QTC4_9EUKA|eukprot:CRZ05258.1 hypothetical protein [Spongospora subterranea]
MSPSAFNSFSTPNDPRIQRRRAVSPEESSQSSKPSRKKSSCMKVDRRSAGMMIGQAMANYVVLEESRRKAELVLSQEVNRPVTPEDRLSSALVHMMENYIGLESDEDLALLATTLAEGHNATIYLSLSGGARDAFVRQQIAKNPSRNNFRSTCFWQFYRAWLVLLVPLKYRVQCQMNDYFDATNCDAQGHRRLGP